ncbi:carbohydrate ABC transporter substrate-binding protein [Kineosporia sp. J2-2]|uniref:Carbohydrate ABC transporter substrate-binding protein n=1 Tax=Kineosporia corallincola TaxID=2835133 RepID=A0ABS5TRQ1_9ACTN|nr:ABC transporter substrate-binding protein [Kineosporia corallincola]MBT0773476.1 carbohydrate ABC transporter substrate-binding protein [Kineosporia corallincola]
MKLNRARRITVLVTATAVMAGTAACGGNDSGGDSATGTISFTWWGGDDRAEKYQQAVALFEKANPDIKVKTSFTDFPNYWTARSTEAAGRALPDVMQMDLSYLREYSENGHLADLSQFSDIDTSGFDEAQLQAGTVDDELLGLSAGTNTFALFVNPALIEKAGVEPLPEDYTWEQYNDWILEVAAKGVKTEDGQPIVGSGDYRGALWIFIQWLVQKGVDPYTDDGQIAFTQDHIREWLALGEAPDTAKAFASASRTTQLKPKSPFLVSEQATELNWDNFTASYITDMDTEVELMPVPTGANGSKEMFWKPSMLLSISNNSEHKTAAAKLTDFLTTDPEVGKIFGNSRGVPSNQAQRDAVVSEEGSADALTTAYEKDVADSVTAETPIPIKGFGSLEATWLTLSEDLAYDKISPDEFVEQFWAEAQQATQ